MSGLHRTDDHDTSIEAAASVEKRLTDIQQQVLNFATSRPNGFTDEDVEDAFYGGVSTYRKRRTELTAMGKIVDSGRRKKIYYNSHSKRMRSMIIWIHADFAKEAL